MRDSISSSSSNSRHNGNSLICYTTYSWTRRTEVLVCTGSKRILFKTRYVWLIELIWYVCSCTSIRKLGMYHTYPVHKAIGIVFTFRWMCRMSLVACDSSLTSLCPCPSVCVLTILQKVLRKYLTIFWHYCLSEELTSVTKQTELQHWTKSITTVYATSIPDCSILRH